jgi:hypothetical protein
MEINNTKASLTYTVKPFMFTSINVKEFLQFGSVHVLLILNYFKAIIVTKILLCVLLNSPFYSNYILHHLVFAYHNDIIDKIDKCKHFGTHDKNYD